MGILIKGDFRSKLTSKLSKYRPKDKNPEYQKEIFSELFSKFPQFKAHVAAYVERNYCIIQVLIIFFINLLFFFRNYLIIINLLINMIRILILIFFLVGQGMCNNKNKNMDSLLKHVWG